MTAEELADKVGKIIEPLGYENIEVHVTGGRCYSLPDLIARRSAVGLGSDRVELGVRAVHEDDSPDWFIDNIIECQLTGVPGCCGMAVITGLLVDVPIQRNGLGTLTLTFMEELASMLNYGGVIGTDISSSPGIALLDSLPGWTPHPTVFENPRTSNDILTYIKEL